MSDTSGWRPLQKPTRSASTDFTPSPFARLARMHGLAAAADGLVTVALAGSIFFSIAPDAARWRVALYLILTIAPFAVVTPLIGPVIDRTRGGRRGMILATAFARALVAFLMVGNIKSILLFPLAFLLLVLQKAYAVAKSAVVPQLVGSQQRLVEGNSKLALLSSIATLGGAAIGALLSVVGGPSWAAMFAVFVYLAAGLVGLQLPRMVVAAAPAQPLERAELRSSGIVLAATGMGVLRGVVGFLTFLLAFELRGGKDGVDVKPLGAAAGAATAVTKHIDIVGDPGAPAWHFGAVVVAAGVGALLGARVAPELRRRLPEERILLGVFAATALAGIAAAWLGGLSGAVLVSLAVGLAAASGKLAFDSLVQRDAPDANYGRSFARFEARFQLTWVLGAFLPVVLPLPERAGFVLVAVAAGFAAVTYFIGTRRQQAAQALAVASKNGSSDETTVMQQAPVDPTDVLERPTSDVVSEHEEPENLEGDDLEGDEVASDEIADDEIADEEPVGRERARPVVYDQHCEDEWVPDTSERSRSWDDFPVRPRVSSVEGVEVDHDVDGAAGASSPRPRPSGADG